MAQCRVSEGAVHQQASRSPVARAVEKASGLGMYAVSRFLMLFGAVCLTIVVLTHVAETFGLFPSMGWGQPDSAGHYLDLASAILGCTLFPVGLIASFIARRAGRHVYDVRSTRGKIRAALAVKREAEKNQWSRICW